MSEGNGADLGHITAMLQQLIVGQDHQGRRIDEQGRRIDEQGRRIDGLTGEIRGLRSDVTGLRQAVVEYHSAVIGHGVLISELDARLRRVEQHLNLPPTV